MKKFDSFESGEKRRETEDLDEEKILDILREYTGMGVSREEMHYFEETYEVDTDLFTLTFTIGDTSFEIRSIDVRGNFGLGRKIINAIHEYADEYDLQVIASNVRGVAEGFWRKMGYQEGDEGGEFFRV